MRHNLAIMQQAVRLGQHGLQFAAFATGQDLEGFYPHIHHRRRGSGGVFGADRRGSCMYHQSHKLLGFGQPCAAAHGRQIWCGDIHPRMRPKFTTADVRITISAQLSASKIGHELVSI